MYNKYKCFSCVLTCGWMNMSTGDVILLIYLFLSFTHVKRVRDLQKREAEEIKMQIL